MTTEQIEELIQKGNYERLMTGKFSEDVFKELHNMGVELEFTEDGIKWRKVK